MLIRIVLFCVATIAVIAGAAGQEGRFVIGPSSPLPALTSIEMLPNLEPGDEIQITPYTGSPNAGDIVAFKVPIDGKTIVARRVIGLPGDTVFVVAGVVALNGTGVKSEKVDEKVHGDRSTIRYRETLPNGAQYEVIDEGSDGPFDFVGPFNVPAGHYFVMGDNRDKSQDSRDMFTVGYIPAANIVGRVEKIAAPAPSSGPPPSVAATPEAGPAQTAEQPAEKPGWFSWLWGESKPDVAPSAAPAAEPPPPESNVAAASPPAAQPAASSGQLAPIPPGCPFEQDFGGWTIRRGSLEGIPVVTVASSATYSGTATKWTTEDLSLEMIPKKDGTWLPMLFVKNLKHGGAPIREIVGPYAVLVWNAATNKILGGVESDAGGNNMYREPHTIIGVAPGVMEKLIDKIEATPKINIALALPKEDGSGLIDIAWISPFQSSGLRAAMAAAKPCALE